MLGEMSLNIGGLHIDLVIEGHTAALLRFEFYGSRRAGTNDSSYCSWTGLKPQLIVIYAAFVRVTCYNGESIEALSRAFRMSKGLTKSFISS